jgi:membrane protein required for colicin V production
VPLIAFKTVASVLSDHVSDGGFGMADRLVGMAFGVVRGAAIVCALYLGVGLHVEPDEQPSWRPMPRQPGARRCTRQGAM